jgi:signal transduction histidine kinase
MSSLPTVRHRKQTLLFLLVVLLPSLTLSGLALHLLRQERQWERHAWEEMRRRTAAELGRGLGLHLERIRLEEQGRPRDDEAATAEDRNPALVLAARQRDGTLALPWEERSTTAPPAAFAALLRDAGRAEFGGDVRGAAELYGRAAEQAPDPAAGAAARLGLARALTAGGDSGAAVDAYGALLALPSSVADEHGVPFALYAADRLRAEPGYRATVAKRLEAEARLPPPLAPLHAYLLRDLLAELEIGPPAGAADHVTVIEQALALRRDLPALLRLAGAGGPPGSAAAAGPADGGVAVAIMTDIADPARADGSGGAGRAGGEASPRDPPWIPYGDPLWLVGMAPALHGGDTLVLAVAADSALAQLAASPDFALPVAVAAGAVRLERNPAAGDPLGPAFPGLRVSLPALAEPPAGAGRRAQFLLLLLPLTLALTAFSGWLLWRDVRREVHAAALRSRFVSSVSHELKTPLTSIRMFAEMLAAGRADDPRRRAEYLDLIVAESGRLTRLINNVLDFARIDEGRRGYRKERVRLDDVIHEAARTMAYPLAQQEVSLNVDTDGTVPAVSADRDAVLQAVLNLLSNAVKFSLPGGEVELRLLRRDGEAWIQVRDQGMGIDAADRERIFDEFYRSPAADAQGIAGAGLGLPLVAHVARGHGGTVDVDSMPGRGSTFTMRLPLEAEP